MAEDQFEFTAGSKKKLIITGIIGLLLLIIGILGMVFGGGHGHDGHGAEEAAHHSFHWSQRLWASLWINNVYFTGLAIIGVFFVALQYVAQAGWSAILKRIPEAFGNWLPYAGMLMLLVFIVGGHDLFHWTHDYLYDKNDPRYDEIIAGKRGYLNTPFFIIRMVIYFVLWYIFYRMIRRESLAEDMEGGTVRYWRMVKYSAIFIIIFAITSSTAAWDWILSIDTHWFSTMIGWYIFATWFVSGLAAITYLIVLLRENGYLPEVSSEHLHDLGKFLFAFSIFWAYIWFGQFLLIYYANIPEESIYFIQRLNYSPYAGIFYMNLILNFFLPFLLLMTKDAKRLTIFLKIVCPIILVGHWIDFYLMVTPGTLGLNGALGFVELGSFLIYSAAFVFVLLRGLAQAPLVARNHPMLQESLHHHT